MIGDPGAEAEGVLRTAKQLVYAYQEAPTGDDEEYAADEIDRFLDDFGDVADSDVLLALLGLPVTDLTRPILGYVRGKLIERAPGVVESLLRMRASRSAPASDNAAAVLAAVSVPLVAQGLVEVLAGWRDDRLKEVAAAALVALGRPAAAPILDALGDFAARPWIVQASGCVAEASDAEVLASIVGDHDGDNAAAGRSSER
ncbi:MAG: hypothetical protein ACLQUT_10240 [Thermoleophilia bacterium]